MESNWLSHYPTSVGGYAKVSYLGLSHFPNENIYNFFILEEYD